MMLCVLKVTNQLCYSMYHGSILEELTSLLYNNFLFIVGVVYKGHSSTSKTEMDDKIQETLKFAPHREKHQVCSSQGETKPGTCIFYHQLPCRVILNMSK